MEAIPAERQQFNSLKDCLNDLIEHYQASEKLMNKQMQAVIEGEAPELDVLVANQLAVYEDLEQLEMRFRQTLYAWFQTHDPAEKELTLTRLMELIEEPDEALLRLQKDLKIQIEDTNRTRKQLLDLLYFARQHNADTFENIFQLGKPELQSYNSAGKKNKNPLNSIAVNQKA